MDCREVRDSLSAYLDQVLGKQNEREIKEHLEKCQDSQEELASLEIAINFSQNGEEVSPPENFRSNLLSRIEEINKEESAITQPKWINRFKKHWVKILKN